MWLPECTAAWCVDIGKVNDAVLRGSIVLCLTGMLKACPIILERITTLVVFSTQVVQCVFSDKPSISFHRELNETPPNKIIFVIVTLLFHPVDCDTLYQVFSRVGTVKKVVLQNKNDKLQGFVEMDTLNEAEEAKKQFNNKHIYTSRYTHISAFFDGPG